MLLAEALAERAEAQRRLEQVQARIHRILRVQEGENPPESPDEVLTEMDKILDRLQMLVRRINKTNSVTAIDEYQSIADAIAYRDIALRRRKLYSEIATRASTTPKRYRGSELKDVSTVATNDLQQEVDRISDYCCELDTKVQKLSWQVQLL